MPKVLSVLAVQRLIDEVRAELLISNDIVSRIEHPYFHSHPSVPKSLQNFKKKLSEYRSAISMHLAHVKTVPPYHPTLSESGNLALDSPGLPPQYA